ncbi:MAG: hypothetical protein QM775_19975 [Pirellulales bacterium]
MRRPLRNQILFPFAGLMAAAILAVSAAGAWQAARTVDNQIDAHVRSAVDVLLTADFPLTDAVLRETRGLTGAELLCVDADGDFRAASMNDARPFLEAARSSPAGASRQAATVNGGEYLVWSAAQRAAIPESLHSSYTFSIRRPSGGSC